MYLKVCLLYRVLHRAVFEKKTAQGDSMRAGRMKTQRLNDYYFFSFEKQEHICRAREEETEVNLLILSWMLMKLKKNNRVIR